MGGWTKMEIDEKRLLERERANIGSSWTRNEDFDKNWCLVIKDLYNPKHRGIVRSVLRNYLYDIFGDEITKNKISIGGKNMNKWELVKEEKFQKGLQIMAILQLMEGDNGMSIPEIKKKCIESGANYESVRRLFKIIKDKGYTSSWDNDRITAMNLIKDIYLDLEKVD